jgi:hypothetical protein
MGNQAPGVVVIRYALAILCLLWPPQATTGASALPAVTLSLPSGLASNTVQISYYLTGPFGGYGGYVDQKPDVDSYEIPSAVGGRPAKELKMIVLATGCDLETFDIPLSADAKMKPQFQCKSVDSVRLLGRIVPDTLIGDRKTELEISYMAVWSHRFYGFADGPVTQFRLATLSLDKSGMFEVGLPLFTVAKAGSSADQEASFQLDLVESETGNLIASGLEPDVPELVLDTGDLRIQPGYPDGLKFSIRRPRN